MTLDDARRLLADGVKFDILYQRLESDADREALKKFFVDDTRTPVVRTPKGQWNGDAADEPHRNGVHRPKPSAADYRKMGYTGESCGQCGSLKVRPNGACTICDDCGKQGGCG